MANLNIITDPELVTPAGVPVVLSLASDEIGGEEYAYALLYISEVSTEPALTINGYTLTAVAGGGLAYGEYYAPGSDAWNDTEAKCATSMVAALADSPLAGSYAFTAYTDRVLVRSRMSGPSWNVNVLTAATLASSEVVPAAAQFESQNPDRVAWGCYAQLFAYPLDTDRNYPTDPANETRAVLVADLALEYSAGNAYPFDLQAWLKDVVESARRDVAYFVRFGEIYATTTQAYRRKYPVGRWPETGVAWALDAALPVLPYADPREPQFLTPFLGIRPARIVDEALWITFSAICDTSGFQIGRLIQSINGGDTSAGELAYSVPLGGVIDITDVGVSPVLDTFDGVILRRRDTIDEGTSEAYPIRLSSTPLPHWLRFRNRLGGLEQWGFTSNEPALKRSLATYQPADGTTQTLRADLTQSLRLTSGLLTRAAFDFLCAELAASPDVEYFTSDASVLPVIITDFDAKSDTLTDEYSIALTIERRAPFIPLSR